MLRDQARLNRSGALGLTRKRSGAAEATDHDRAGSAVARLGDIDGDGLVDPSPGRRSPTSPRLRPITPGG